MRQKITKFPTKKVRNIANELRKVSQTTGGLLGFHLVFFPEMTQDEEKALADSMAEDIRKQFRKPT